MAIDFSFDTVIDDKTYVNKFSTATGLSERFLECCRDLIVKTEFPNVECSIDEYVSGGIFFNREKTKMLSMSFKQSTFKQLGVFFRAQQFGNIVIFTKYETIEQKFWDADNRDALVNVRKKCKNVAQWEEFVALRKLGDIVFWDGLRTVDPGYEAKQKLASLAPGSESSAGSSS